MAESTSTMLARMGAKTNLVAPGSSVAIEKVDAPLDTPKLTLKPTPDMENALSHILGSSLAKQNSPMD